MTQCLHLFCFAASTSHGLSCGVVVNLGHETASVSAAWDGSIMSSCTTSLDVSASADDVAEAVGQVIESASEGDEHIRSVLTSNVVLAGKYRYCINFNAI